jgi:hypothetical protein
MPAIVSATAVPRSSGPSTLPTAASATALPGRAAARPGCIAFAAWTPLVTRTPAPSPSRRPAPRSSSDSVPAPPTQQNQSSRTSLDRLMLNQFSSPLRAPAPQVRLTTDLGAGQHSPPQRTDGGSHRRAQRAFFRRPRQLARHHRRSLRTTARTQSGIGCGDLPTAKICSISAIPRRTPDWS